MISMILLTLTWIYLTIVTAVCVFTALEIRPARNTYLGK